MPSFLTWTFTVSHRLQTFSVGTGLSDKQRRDPPKIGAIITYRFFELTRDGVPRSVQFCSDICRAVSLKTCRFPSYVGEAVDKDEPKDAEISKGGGKRGEDKDAEE